MIELAAGENKMEEDSSKTKKDLDLSSSHSTPKTSLTHSHSSSTTLTPNSGRNLIAGSSNFEPSGAEATDNLSTEAKEKGAIGGGSSGDVKAEKGNPLLNTTATLSDKNLEISLGEGERLRDR